MAIETVELLWSKPTCARRLHFTRQFSATICAVVALTAAPAADAKFGELRSDGGGNTMVRFLAAHGPNDDLGKGAATFARFEGDWTVDCIYIDEKGNKQPTAGEWHFGWILAGRAFQDVIYFYPAGERPKDPSQLRGGTTVRVYDPKRGQWTITWNNAAKGWAILLRGGAVDDRIILTGSDIDGSALRWTFHDISPRRFLWRGEVSKDGGVTWRIEQTMVVTREGAALRPRY